MKKEIAIKIPEVPNFILSENPDVKFSIIEFTEDELRKIGELWTEKLVLKLKEPRIRQ